MKLTTQKTTAQGQQLDLTVCEDSIMMKSTFGASTPNLPAVFGLKF